MTIFLLTMPDDLDLATKCAERCAKQCFRDVLNPSITVDKTVIPVLKLIKLVLQQFDTPVYDMLGGSAENKEGFSFAIAWVITWFSHNIHTWKNLQRLYDLFLSRRPFFVIYFCAAFISENKEAIAESLD